MANPSTTVQLSNGAYDNVKRAVTLVLPALGALYFGVAQIWGLPNGEEVVGTIAALNVFLGVLLNVSSHSYTSETDVSVGTIDIVSTDAGTQFKFSLDGPPDRLVDMQNAKFRVNSQL